MQPLSAPLFLLVVPLIVVFFPIHFLSSHFLPTPPFSARFGCAWYLALVQVPDRDVQNNILLYEASPRDSTCSMHAFRSVLLACLPATYRAHHTLCFRCAVPRHPTYTNTDTQTDRRGGWLLSLDPCSL